MNDILDQLGEYREVEIGDASLGTNRTARCLEACEDQQNEVAVTTSKLPNRQTMLNKQSLHDMPITTKCQSTY